MELDYFGFMDKPNIADYKLFLISGDEPLQKHNIIEKINNSFKEKNYEIARYDISEQNHDVLYHEADSLSLFSMDKFIQFTLDKPPLKNLQKALVDNLCKPSDNSYLVIFSGLKKQNLSTKWFQSLSQNAIHVHIYDPNINVAIRIIKSEILKENELSLSDEAIQMLAQKTEGNLIATKQILKLLGRQNQKTFDEQTIKPFLHEHTNYNVFDLSDAIIEQKKAKALTILNHILLERDKATLILWTLKRELRIIFQLQETNPSYHQKVFRENNIWPSKQKYYSSLINRVHNQNIILNLQKCLNTDLCIKGVKKGNVKIMLNEIVFDLIK
ncbi:DNA polymerase III subunit delta [Francisella frigiditurris]|uniref:DNA polymerase III subunit delta n=1 Tax=Francisella frigiditurris TaxID=1542390 RepID=A0A1J0KUW8_9GAMM|nr:DNA polymerase III subunit delta [Francisella frigiditurris]APC97474.1 DNA polymerase III, delta subunit [Francisella frigiditurris]